MNQLCSKAKGDPRLLEDVWVITPHYSAVFDGATPKTAFRFADGSTPGQMAARTLAQALQQIPPGLSARTAIDKLTTALASALDGNSAEASGVICSHSRHEIWSIGDCSFALLHADGTFEQHHTDKLIDRVLADWRSSIIRSYLSRGIMTVEQIQANDPGRRIIQPFISHQTRFQNIPPKSSPYAFGVFDGHHIPSDFIEATTVPNDVTDIILASDGYPTLLPTLQETEVVLQRMLQDDPLCIDALRGTKGIKPGAIAHDDRTYLKIAVPWHHIGDRTKCSTTHPSQP